MMDRLTDNEIVKVLECCVKQRCESCLQYGMYADDENCMRFVMENALDLINRKDAEIERYKSNEKFINEKCDSFLENAKKIPYALKMDVAQAKSEAYKEFAEKVKEEITKTLWRVITDLKYEGNKLFLSGLIFENIDNTLKELTKG